MNKKYENRQLLNIASHGNDSKGRKYEDSKLQFNRTEYQRDRDRILYSDAFKRLKHKTQVFFNTKNDHVRTRLTHTLEVAQLARSVARYLNLNDDLAEAISFPDHHTFTPEELQCLSEKEPLGQLTTTLKDYVRLPETFAKRVMPVKVKINWKENIEEHLPIIKDRLK